jgi:two-component sensor histidine kinase
MESGDTLTVEEHLTNTPLGERQVLSRKVPLRDRNGNSVGILGASLDITERKRAEEATKAALKEKEVLLRELYHRTKNNMQVISSMLALQSYYIDNKEALQIFKDMENRIQSMALVHQKLYQSQNLSRINLSEYVSDLAVLLLRSYATSYRISLDIDAEDVFVLIDTAMPCGLILNELISNALKHAFPEGNEGIIMIVLHRSVTNHIELVVADNGIGVPEDFDFRRTGTLGLQNVVALAERQLDGEITFTVKDGLSCQITFRDDLYQERV